MNALIIEDEIVAQQAMVRMLKNNFPEISICATLDSVSKSVEWLSNTEIYPDLIFMDVELSDGKCFDIFERISIHCPVIMVTAYDNYAIKAFEVNSLDYILKPVEFKDLQRAIERCRRQTHNANTDSALQSKPAIKSGGGNWSLQAALPATI